MIRADGARARVNSVTRPERALRDGGDATRQSLLRIDSAAMSK